jgi:hypothetical protein
MSKKIVSASEQLLSRRAVAARWQTSRETVKRREKTIELSKTTLTHRFAANPSRRGAMTSARLYNEVLSDLQKRGLARLLPRNEKLQVYQFPVE